MKRINVGLDDRSYPISIGSGVLDSLPELLRETVKSKRLAIVTDSNVAKIYLERIKKDIEDQGLSVNQIIIPAGEEYKTVSTAEKIFDNLIAQNWDRWSPLIALGGGVVGDITGFAAACFMRGIPYIQIPTTLLAMVDSSVGGKTGVNHPKGKNLIGAFYQPKMVAIDLEVLKTLPEAELIAAMAEVIKYGVIKNEELFRYLENHLDDILDLKSEELGYVIGKCCEIKAEVVELDEREAGLRAILNYGHTVGHAIEQASNYRIYRHGEAVGLGMIAAAEFSQILGYCGKDDEERIKTLLSMTGFPAEIDGSIKVKDVLEAINLDKKREDKQINFVFVKKIGEVILEKIFINEHFKILKGISIFK